MRWWEMLGDVNYATAGCPQSLLSNTSLAGELYTHVFYGGWRLGGALLPACVLCPLANNRILTLHLCTCGLSTYTCLQLLIPLICLSCNATSSHTWDRHEPWSATLPRWKISPYSRWLDLFQLPEICCYVDKPKCLFRAECWTFVTNLFHHVST